MDSDNSNVKITVPEAKALRDRTLKAFDEGVEDFTFDFGGVERTMDAKYAYHLCLYLHTQHGWDCNPGPRPWVP
ncbi:hypothetical protein R0K05_17300 [Planococcus sp. SIMBA_160]